MSDDGKTVTGFIADKNNKTRLPYVRIPYGVEKICSEAIYDKKIDLMFTPDEFEDDKIYRSDSVKRIFTECDNKYLCSDDIGKYRYLNGKRYLMSFNKTDSREYVIPDDVVGLHADSVSFGKCTKLVLSKSMEKFNENAISDSYVNCDSHLEIVVPESLRRILTDSEKRSDDYSYYDAAAHRSVMINPIRYRIDENNPYLFIDEDSVYQVLDDGTYKLVMNSYFGLGKALILDGTSVIGKYAFCNHENLNDIEFPESVRVIEKGAFSETSLLTLKIPHYIERIDSAAFSDCYSLKSVTLYPTLKSIAKDAFDGCSNLDKVLTPGNNKAFEYKNHNGKRKIRQLVFETKEEFMKKAEDNRHKYAWIKDKVFVHTGLSLQEESEFDSFIFENGGTVRKSTVLNTDYLVYNADYDHETVKLRKARELKEKGSGIEILTTEEWKKADRTPNELSIRCTGEIKMSQVNTRLHIRVASYDVWKRFKKQDLSEYELEDLSEIDADSYVIDESSFDDIEDIVRIISKVLGKDGIVIADLTDLNIDPFTECYFLFRRKSKKGFVH